jgi:hypothetical protein
MEVLPMASALSLFFLSNFPGKFPQLTSEDVVQSVPFGCVA